MKTNKIKYMILSSILLTSCSPTNTKEMILFLNIVNEKQENCLNEYGLANNIQDGMILHAFNVSYNTIKDNLQDIANSGYSAIQTSPVQQSKSKSTGGTWSTSWAMLYQPVSFSIAEHSPLGTKDELTDLCNEASKYGIKIICDIVSNHMANDNSGNKISERINDYEPEIYQNKDIYFHNNNFGVSDSSIQYVTQGNLSNLPDLDTSNIYIQERVKSLLKECIDCGVSGFRFDAAKHIETDEDDVYASDYWNNVLNYATEYALNTYSKQMYYYGEILNNPGAGRTYESYTKNMSVTDTGIDYFYLNGVTGKNVDMIINNVKSEIQSDGKKSVFWAESHDTYSDGSTSKLNYKKINRTWAIEASRNGMAGLYLIRPEENTAMGDIGTKYYKSLEVAASNKFHNKFIGANEIVSNQKGMFVNERYFENGLAGIVIVDVIQENYGKQIKIKTNKLADKKYYDQITGNEFVCQKGYITGTMSDSGITILLEEQPEIYPDISISNEKGYYYDSFDITINAINHTSLSYNIDGGNDITIKSGDKITINSDKDSITINVKASYNEKTITKSYQYFKANKKEGYYAICGLKDPETNNYFAWTWKTGSQGSWCEVEIEGNTAYLKENESFNNFLLASFTKDIKIGDLNSNSWDIKIGQTEDFKCDLNKVYYSNI